MSNECICPQVEISAKPGQVSEETQLKVADLLNALVTVNTGDGRTVTVFGKHRTDCPCLN